MRHQVYDPVKINTVLKEPISFVYERADALFIISAEMLVESQKQCRLPLGGSQ